MKETAAHKKARLIRLLHVAKSQLQMDDAAYRTLLANASRGKTSSKAMGADELETALRMMKAQGFVVTLRQPENGPQRPAGARLRRTGGNDTGAVAGTAPDGRGTQPVGIEPCPFCQTDDRHRPPRLAGRRQCVKGDRAFETVETKRGGQTWRMSAYPNW